MNLTFFEKIITIFRYTFSSFLSIELFLFSLLLFVLLIVNLKRKEKLVIYAAIIVYIGILIGTMIAYNEYVIMCFNAFLKLLVTYVCFPTIVAFFATMVLITAIMIYTLFSSKLTKFKKTFNFLIFSVMYFFFLSVITLTAYHNIDIGNTIELYTNNYVLALIQGSNVLLLFWFIYTFFYRLYEYFKLKFD